MVNRIVIVFFADCITGKLHGDGHKRQMVYLFASEHSKNTLTAGYMFFVHGFLTRILCYYRRNIKIIVTKKAGPNLSVCVSGTTGGGGIRIPVKAFL